MKIEVVQATNWLSHVDSELAPNGARFMTIRGDHGVGKTALVEAIAYALFGRGRFATADEPVRIGATDMSVRVEWTDAAGQRYRVIRRRSTKSGGKGSLNFALQRPDGAWTSLDGDGIKGTEAEIRKVVGVDGATFEAIAFLMQGRITALVEATASGRRDVLVAGLLLEVWPKAATRSRKIATELEAAQAAARHRLDTIEFLLLKLPEAQSELATERAALASREAEVSALTERRDASQERIRELEAKLAETDRLTADLARVEGERKAVLDDWHRAQDRWTAAGQAMEQARQAIGDAAAVEAAAAGVPAARAAVEALVAGEAEDRRLTREIADMDRAIRDLEIPHRNALATWTAQHDAAAAKAAELEAHARAGTSVCATCGQAIKQDTALAQLKAAREAVKALGERPEEPISIARARAGKVRLESRLRELAWDPGAMILARDDLTRLERTAARGEAIAAARGILERSAASLAEAEADKARLTAKGQSLRDQIAALQAAIDQAGPIRAERSDAVDALARAVLGLEAGQAGVRSIERSIAGIEAQLEQLHGLEEEAAGIRTSLTDAGVEIARQRKLAAAFGEIPLRIIDASLPELEAEAQGLLDILDPGMTVAITAQRATVDGKRIVSAIDITCTDAVGSRDVRMLSGGEQVAVSVALSLGLRRVLARQHGAQLRTAFIDEPDGLDALQRRALGEAAMALVHSGDLDRMGLITHHEDLAEAGETQYVVSKNGHGSQVTQVA